MHKEVCGVNTVQARLGFQRKVDVVSCGGGNFKELASVASHVRPASDKLSTNRQGGEISGAGSKAQVVFGHDKVLTSPSSHVKRGHISVLGNRGGGKLFTVMVQNRQFQFCHFSGGGVRQGNRLASGDGAQVAVLDFGVRLDGGVILRGCEQNDVTEFNLCVFLLFVVY